MRPVCSRLSETYHRLRISIRPIHPKPRILSTLYKHAAYYLDNVAAHGVPMYLAVHERASPDWQVRVADRMGCAGVFLGGPLSWKRSAAEETVVAAHARGLGVHVGRPEREAAWFFEVGVDSVDTGGFVRNSACNRLGRLDYAVTSRETEQATLGGVTGDAVA